MKLAFSVLLLSFSCAAQSIMPPLLPAFQPPIKAHGNTNDYTPHLNSITMTWTLSKSPNIEFQIVDHSYTIPYSWSLLALVDSNQTSYTVSRTNHPQEFFTVQAVNTYGVASSLPQ